MTAIGLLMCVMGWLLVRLYGSPYSSLNMFNLADWIGMPVAIVGFILLNIGVFTKLWQVMP